MTHKEAKWVAEIATTADGNCPECSYYLMEKLIMAFPEHKSIFLKTYSAKFTDKDLQSFSKNLKEFAREFGKTGKEFCDSVKLLQPDGGEEGF